VAPDADLVAVRIGGAGRAMEMYFLARAACVWLDRLAGDRPLVVPCSFGGHMGGHDGYMVAERQLSEVFAPERKGRVLCVAGGNEREVRLHAGLTLGGPDRSATLRWVPQAQESKVCIYMEDVKKDDLAWDTQAEGRPGEVPYIHNLSGSLVLDVPGGQGPRSLRLWTRSG
jgi:hypothetical protein